MHTRALLLLASICLLLTACTTVSFPELNLKDEVTFESDDRILILAPHPDDEVIACGGVIQKALAKGLPVHVAYLTYGDNNEWAFIRYEKRVLIAPQSIRNMGLVRRLEGIAACEVLGLPPEDLSFLGYPDFGTLTIWNNRWNSSPPFRSMLTRVTVVPYTNAFHFGALYKGESILGDLTQIFRSFRPTKIFVSHPEDQNPDHRSLYLFTRVALWDLRQELKAELLPYLVHFKSWPLPKGYRPDQTLSPPESMSEGIPWKVLNLNEDELALKREALRKHKTQYDYSHVYLESFLRKNEFFGDYPVVELTNNHEDKELGGEKDLLNPPEELSPEQRARYTGVQRRYIRLEDRELVLNVTLSKPLANTVGAVVELFGYRSDKPFADMPKIKVTIGPLAHTVYDQFNALPAQSVRVVRRAREFTLRIPLEIIGNPEKILTSARINAGGLPLSWAAWRVLKVPPSAGKPLDAHAQRVAVPVL